MISFTRGLILRKGMRELEFERQIEHEKVQFKFLDTHEVMTYNLAKLYKQIQTGEYAVVKSLPGDAPANQNGQTFELPSKLTKAQEAVIAFRLKFVAKARKLGITKGAISRLKEVVEKVQVLDGIDKEESEIFRSMKKPSPWSISRWINLYESSGENSYALLDRRVVKKSVLRLSAQAESFMEQLIAKVYLQLSGPTMRKTHEILGREIRQHNLMQGESVAIPSLSTLERRIEQIPGYIVDYKRLGPGYAKNKWRYSLAGDQSKRVLERTEIDHTLLDVWVLDPKSGLPLGRPWITVLIDRYSGYILGVYISFYGPSASTVAASVKMAISPKSGLLEVIPDVKYPWTAMGVPESIVVDNGMEFHSAAFRRIAWELRTDVIFNPVRQPWLKSSIERTMMEFNRVLPMHGRVYPPLKNADRIDPRKTALIEFYDLCRCLMVWAVDEFPRHIHPKTLVRPIDLWEEGLQEVPPPRLPLQTLQLDLAMGLQASRVVDGDGVFFKYLRFNSPELQDHRSSMRGNFRTELRINPDNIGSMHVHLPKADKWIVVPMQKPSHAYGQGFSLMQHELIRREAKAKLTKSNAYEVLEQVRLQTEEIWGSFAKRGKQIRKATDLIRSQGLTSAKLVAEEPSSSPLPVPEVCKLFEKNLPKVIPFKGFSMAEDE